MSKQTAKWFNRGECREMARADGWVMVRRPRCVPFTMFAKEWDALPSAEDGRKYQQKTVANISRHTTQP